MFIDLLVFKLLMNFFLANAPYFSNLYTVVTMHVVYSTIKDGEFSETC